jgi:hypothetical protein
MVATQPKQSLLGEQAFVAVDPLRDVLISLLANLGAWAVGVFIAYFCHDPNPDFMDATAQHQKASRNYYRARRAVSDEIRTVEAKFGKEMEQMERAANSRAAAVATERGLLEQVNKQENDIIEAIRSVLSANVEHYRDTLAQIALAKRGEVSIVRIDGSQEKPITPYEYKSLEIGFDADFIRDLAANT